MDNRIETLSMAFASLDDDDRARLLSYADEGGEFFCGPSSGETFLSPDGIPTPSVVAVSSDALGLRRVPMRAVDVFASMSGVTSCRYVEALMNSDHGDVVAAIERVCR